jgi:hypothetical protein
MNVRRVFKILLVLAAALGGWWMLRTRVPELLVPAEPEAHADLPPAPTGMYEGATTRLWSDRDYHTVMDVHRLEGLHFTRIGRREERHLLLHVMTTTTLYTLANHGRAQGLSGWSVLPDSVLIPDAYAPRSFDRLWQRQVGPGFYVVRNPLNGPSHPVFFDGSAVRATWAP